MGSRKTNQKLYLPKKQWDKVTQCFVNSSCLKHQDCNVSVVLVQGKGIAESLQVKCPTELVLFGL